jgi:murein DD-endopeptidase MepM/ murein hydrolase activator NlpD
MRISAVAFCMILTTIFLSGCGKTTMATLDAHGDKFYGREGTRSTVAAAPVVPVEVAGASFAPSAPLTARDLAPPSPSLLPSPSPLPQPPALAAAPAPAHWQWPVEGAVVESFGQKSEGIANEGLRIAAPEGSPIKAAQAGEVAFVGNDTKTYGNIVILRHNGGIMTSYAHARDIAVHKGQRVAAGAVIGTVGRSGNAKAPQLHFALREGGTSIDPMRKLPQHLASVAR